MPKSLAHFVNDVDLSLRVELVHRDISMTTTGQGNKENGALASTLDNNNSWSSLPRTRYEFVTDEGSPRSRRVPMTTSKLGLLVASDREEPLDLETGPPRDPFLTPIRLPLPVGGKRPEPQSLPVRRNPLRSARKKY